MERPAEKLVSHHPWLRRLARRMVRSSASADDLVQDTCITALRNAPPDAEMRPWLRSVMRKLAWGHYRSETRRAQREEIFYQAEPPMSEPDALLEYGVDRARLAEAVATLPEPFRSTVVQRFVEGLSCAEIARAEQVPQGTVRWRQTRALELLRNELDGSAQRKRARRRHVIWGLPIFGVGERIVTQVGRGLFSLAQRRRPGSRSPALPPRSASASCAIPRIRPPERAHRLLRVRSMHPARPCTHTRPIAIATTCEDIHGTKKTVCEDAPPKDCVSEVQGFGLLCTTCTVDGQPVTTCTPAECHVSNRCLECEDPKGNTGVDCSLDYEAMYTASASYGSGDTFNACTTS